MSGTGESRDDGNAVVIKDLGKSFGKTSVLRGVSLEVPHKSFTTLLGASGSGKTTCLRVLAGLEKPDEGEVWLSGQLVNAPKRGVNVPTQRRGVGLVFQSYALWPHKTVFDHVAYPLQTRHDTENLRERVQDALEIVGLSSLPGRYPSELSGGQQQRVAIARAIVYRPEVLLLDEPLSNLDAELRDKMRVELRRLHDQLGLTTVYVTHDQSEALMMSDQIIIMDSGEVIERGTPQDVYERPRTREVARFLGTSNSLGGECVSVHGDEIEIRLDCGLTLVHSLPQHDIKPRTRVVVTFKAEDVQVTAGIEQSPTGLHAEVLNVAYLGAYQEMVLAVQGSGETLRLRVPKKERVSVGLLVTVEMDKELVQVFRETNKSKGDSDE